MNNDLSLVRYIKHPNEKSSKKEYRCLSFFVVVALVLPVKGCTGEGYTAQLPIVHVWGFEAAI